MLDSESLLTQEKVLQSTIRWIRERQLLRSGDRVLLAVSGGLDSSVLMHVMSRVSRLFQVELGVAHVNHGTRGLASVQEKTWVRVHAERLGLPFFERSIPTGLQAHSETALREARQNELLKLAHEQGFQRIATAHHATDNAETLLMRMMSGTGVQGLSGIRPQRGPWIRPLLPLLRTDLESYAANHAIAFVEDPSNARSETLRNALRHQIIPQLEALRLGSLRNLSRLAMRIEDEDDELSQMLLEDLEESSTHLPLQKLDKWPTPLKRRLLHLWLRRLDVDSDPALVEALLKGSEVVHRRGVFLRRSDMLMLSPEPDFSKLLPQEIPVEFGKKIALGPSVAWSFLPDPRVKPLLNVELSVYFVFRPPGMKDSPLRMDWDLLPWPLQIRKRRQGEKLPQLDRMLEQAKIPRPFAAHWPLVVSQKDPDLVVGGVGIGVFDAYRLKRRARSVSMECFFEQGLKRSLETC